MRWLARVTAVDAAFEKDVSSLEESLAVDGPGADEASALCSVVRVELDCSAVPELAGVAEDVSDGLATVSSVWIRRIVGLAPVFSEFSPASLSGKLLAFSTG